MSAEIRRLIEDMQRASARVDNADDPQGYQIALVSLAMIARQYLRLLAASTRESERKPSCENGDCRDHYGDSDAWCVRCAAQNGE